MASVNVECPRMQKWVPMAFGGHPGVCESGQGTSKNELNHQEHLQLANKRVLPRRWTGCRPGGRQAAGASPDVLGVPETDDPPIFTILSKLPTKHVGFS